MKGDVLDPKGLILEAYRIEGITLGECRSIFLDWALSMPGDLDTRATIVKLIERYRPGHPEHPMTQVLIAGDVKMSSPRRRGGWRSRPRN